MSEVQKEGKLKQPKTIGIGWWEAFEALTGNEGNADLGKLEKFWHLL